MLLQSFEPKLQACISQESNWVTFTGEVPILFSITSSPNAFLPSVLALEKTDLASV